jgi:Cdc6-like AAA superfamily ATPase
MTATRAIVYPDRQPFPRSTAVRVGDDQSHETLSRSEALPTFPTVPFKLTQNQLEAYLRNFREEVQEDGVTVAIYGAYGSGKTHLLRYLFELGRTRRSGIQQAYTRVESTDFLGLYKSIAAAVDAATIERLNTRILSRLVQKEASKTDASKGAEETLKLRPELVYEYLSRALFSPSTIAQAQAEWVRQITKAEDFLRAVSYLSDPTLRQDAYQWLRGEGITDAAMRKLGVHGAIDTIDKAKGALYFLITLFGEARQPFLLYIDQIERLLPDSDPTIAAANEAALSSIAEWAQEKQTFLCVAGATRQPGVAADFTGRFRVVVPMPRLDEMAACNLIKVYLSTTPTFVPYVREEDIFPFRQESVAEMVNISDGNIRTILRLAYQSFEDACAQRRTISSEDVKNAFRKFGEYFDDRAILAVVKGMLGGAGLKWTEQFIIENDMSVDLAVLNAAGPTAFIEVTSAVFHDDEAENAIRYTKTAHSLRSQFPSATLVLIAAGYLSQEVRSRLASSRAADHYLVYSPDRFESEFRPIVISLASVRSIPGVNREQTQSALSDLEGLQSYFEKVLDQRLETTKGLETQMRAFLDQQRKIGQTQVVQAAEQRRREFSERERIRIDRAQEAKDRRENEERERLRADGEQERKRRSTQRAVLVGGGSFVVCVLLGWFYLMTNYSLRYEIAKGGFGILPLALLVGIFAGAAIGWGYYLTGIEPFSSASYNRIVRTVKVSVPRLADLEQLVLRIARSEPNISQVAMRRCLRDPNPQVRYAGAQIIGLQHLKLKDELLLGHLRNETWIKAEAALLNTLVLANKDGGSLTMKALLEHLSLATDTESLYVIDAIQRLRASSADEPPLSIDFLLRRPVHVVSHAILSRLVSPTITATNYKPRTGQERFARDFTLGYLKDTSIDSQARRLGSTCSEHPANLAETLTRSDLGQISTERIEELIRTFGLGDETSLGYHDTLGNASVYADIYAFLVKIRMTIEDLQAT